MFYDPKIAWQVNKLSGSISGNDKTLYCGKHRLIIMPLCVRVCVSVHAYTFV